jgi:membrane-bound metal-dependent hydrolase YbcI (DUF457 family)
MPSRDVHVPVGLGTAFITSLYLSKDQKPEHQIYEAIGALFCGYWGSRLPDVFEPANNPHHRAVAHSLATGTAISATAIEAATAWSMFFREKAERLAKHRQTMRSPEVEITSGVFEILLRIAAGAGPGLIAAYMSHLALDACTRRSLPLA